MIFLSDRFLNWLEEFTPHLIAAAVIFLLGILLDKLVLKVMHKGLSMRRTDVTIHKFLTSVVHTVLLIIIIVMALSALQVPMSSIVATIGAAGLAIGLALQNSLSNVAGGFIILFSKPFKCGDYVKIGDSEGTVDAISILYTTLKTLENKMIFIPNGVVSQSTITNITADDKRRLELKFSISYNDDHNKAMAILREMLNDEPRVINEPDKPLVAICEHGASAIILIMRVWIPTDAYWEIRYDTNFSKRQRNALTQTAFPYHSINLTYIYQNKKSPQTSICGLFISYLPCSYIKNYSHQYCLQLAAWFCHSMFFQDFQASLLF